jgi:osmotically-inducible protein OsmY
MQGRRTSDDQPRQRPLPNRDAHEFERERERRPESGTYPTMHDPRTGEPVSRPGRYAVPQRYLDDDTRHGTDRTARDDRHPTGTMQPAESADDAVPWDREVETRFTGRGYHYPGGARYADETARREARYRTHFDEHHSWDIDDRDELWRRGEYGSRLYGSVVGAATPSGTAGISRYGRGGIERQGPKGYVRSDERLRDDICERLADEAWIDLSGVDVHVEEGRVRLEGSVPDRFSKHAIENIADGAWGVKDVENRLQVRVA